MKQEIIFEDEESFKKYLDKHLPFDSERVIRHEEAHFEKAKELRYLPKYAIRKIDDFRVIPFVSIDEKIKPKDLKEICLAPETPSKRDRIYSSDFFGFFYNLYYKFSKNKK